MQRVWFGLLVVSAGAVWGASADLEIATAGNWSRDEFRSGRLVFSDRTYRLAQPPAVLDGKAFVRAPIDGMRVTSRTAGTVCALTPRRVPHATSLEESLTRQGFVRDASIPLFSLFGTNEHEKVYAYRKDVKAGESFRLRKWAVLVDVGAVACRRPAPTDWTKNDGERLYNGIVLPREWPPENIDLNSSEPMPVPYLAHPPAVVDIDVGRQLFVDDFLVESSDFLRMYKLPRRHPANPIFRPEAPLEFPKGTLGGVSRPGVWYVPELGVYRMWYVAGTYFRGTVFIAESKDGLHWTRPVFDVNPGTNQTWPMEFQSDSWSVFPDPFAAPGTPVRWKLFATNPGGIQSAWSFDSTDGVHWAHKTSTGRTGDRATMFFNPFRRKWVYSVRAIGKGRVRKYRECDDFLAGADWDYDELPWWTGADRLDPPEPGYNHVPQLYNLDAVAYESLMLGFFEIHRGPENHVCDRRGLPKLNEITFGYSRDGFHWSRPDHRAHLPASRADTWDRGFLETCGNCCAIVGDELWFFYSGCRGDEDLRTDPTWGSMYDRNAIGVATLRRDGFCALSAGGSVATLTTRPVRFSGSHLFVNVDAARGEFRAEVLDADGKPIEGFTADKCRPVTTDSTKVAVTWPQDLSSLANHPVRFRFTMRKGDFYSFWVAKDARGASNGWLAGGGTGYRAWRDE